MTGSGRGLSLDEKLASFKEDFRQEQQDYQKQLEANLQRTIRNEIIPELREISTYSHNMLKRQKVIKEKALQKTVVGRVEWVKTINPEAAFRARVDSGAQTNSMHAENIKEVSRDGKDYVEFTSVDDEGAKHRFLREVLKKVKVKSTSGHSEDRYVVKMDLVFGGKRVTTNVNLNDRESLKHNFLIGRNLLLGNYIVDVSQSRLLGKEKDEQN